MASAHILESKQPRLVQQTLGETWRPARWMLEWDIKELQPGNWEARSMP